MGFMKNLGELLKTRSDFFVELLQHIVLSLIAIVIITVVGVTTGVLISKSKKAASVVIALAGIGSFIGVGGLGVAIWRGITSK